MYRRSGRVVRRSVEEIVRIAGRRKRDVGMRSLRNRDSGQTRHDRNEIRVGDLLRVFRCLVRGRFHSGPLTRSEVLAHLVVPFAHQKSVAVLVWRNTA